MYARGGEREKKKSGWEYILIRRLIRMGLRVSYESQLVSGEKRDNRAGCEVFFFFFVYFYAEEKLNSSKIHFNETSV